MRLSASFALSLSCSLAHSIPLSFSSYAAQNITPMTYQGSLNLNPYQAFLGMSDFVTSIYRSIMIKRDTSVLRNTSMVQNTQFTHDCLLSSGTRPDKRLPKSRAGGQGP